MLNHTPLVTTPNVEHSRNPKTAAPTAIVMLNLGGPRSVDEVGSYLERMFLDCELIPLPFQERLGRFIARRRTPKIQAKYARIGGGSPIYEWTKRQGEAMAQLLDQLSPETAPHKSYIAFRYAEPLTEEALMQMRADGVRRAVAFTQYPQWSCSTTGASLNELWRELIRLNLRDAFEWSVIDRWPAHQAFVEAMAKKVCEGLDQFAPAERSSVLLLFSAHSLPLSVIERGDAYPQEVAATVQAVMERLNFSNEFLLAYQSDIKPFKWLGPSTEQVIRNLGARKRKNVMVVPIAFTSDHIETLHEIDIEYAELAHEAGIANFKRAPALNDDPLFVRALAEIVAEHLRVGRLHSSQYKLRCPGCENAMCRSLLNPAKAALQARAVV
ncbi:MAG: ferrochelatase [Anaerolineae bacterium]|nr:ferrochelatase [Candidatus Roseilinea sp.]MDW8448519.1 ferrochelatase [Anaerolineae bacterium]